MISNIFDFFQFLVEHDMSIVIPEGECKKFICSSEHVEFEYGGGDAFVSVIGGLTVNYEKASIGLSVVLDGDLYFTDAPFKEDGIPSCIHRNFSIMKRGKVIPETVVVRGSDSDILDLSKSLPSCSVIDAWTLQTKIPEEKVVILDDSVDLANKVAEVTVRKANQKVMGDERKAEKYEKQNPFFRELDDECVEWLYNEGVREGGFSPKTKNADKGSPSVKFSIKGASTIPSVRKTIEKINSGKKLNTGDLIMKSSLDDAKNHKYTKEVWNDNKKAILVGQLSVLPYSISMLDDDAKPIETKISFSESNETILKVERK